MARREWKPLDLTQLPDVHLIACDPSLTALGLVNLRIKDARATVLGAEKLATAPTERQGWDDTFYRAELMEALVHALVDCWLEDEADDVIAVREGPPTGGGEFVRIEASALTGYGFGTVASEFGLAMENIVTPQSHKKLICGNHLAKKPEHHAALKLLLSHIDGSEMIKNEATRDALSVALYAAWRIGERSK